MKRNLTFAVLCLIAGITFFANSPTQAQSRTPWADSLRRSALSAQTEPTLQHVLDSLGYHINVATDELGKELFCGKGGLNTATMVIEVAGSAVYAMSGYYKKSDTSTFYQLFGPSAEPGDSVTFTFSAFDSIGFYMKPNLPGDPHTWLTQNSLNSDGFNHAKVFSTGVLHEYIIAFEDLPDGGDMDWNDLVIKVNFKNFPPQIHLCGHLDDTPDENATVCDTSVIQCTSQPICIHITASDPNCQGDSITVTKISGNGTFAAVKGFRNLSTQHCFTPSGPGTYTFVFKVTDQLGASDQDTIHIIVTQGTKPTVVVRDTTLFLCSPSQVCLPISITDPNCDITSVTSTLGSYSGTVSGFDQVQRLLQLGGTVTQVGGGQPGKVLTVGSDFVAPVNTQSGVSVTLPNFAFANNVVDAGSFTTGVGPTNSATQLLGAPTNLTYTTVGAGGPDGGNGDGALDFATNNFCMLGFPQTVTSCNGSDVDMFLFTNTLGGGTAELRFQNGNTIVKTLSLAIPSGSSGSGLGGIAIDLPDGVTYNQLRIKATSGTFDIDAVAIRTAPSSSTADICFNADTTGTYRVIVTATDSCGNVGADTALAHITINRPPVANAGTDLNKFLCSSSQICFPVTFTDPDNNIKTKELTSATGTLTGGNICYTPVSSGTTSFIIKVTDSCGAIDFDTVQVTATLNAPPVATNGPTTTKFLCSSTQQCYQFTATDPNGGPLTWSMLSGAGAITSGGNWCFTPANSGTYNASVVVTDSCGAKDTATIVYTITLNAKPVAVDPATPVSVFQCTPTQICYQFGASDANGGTLIWTKLSGSGTVTNVGQWCFTPVASGAYTTQVRVEDSCGAADTTTLTYNVTVNGAPNIAFGSDTTLNLCAPQQVCLAYTVSDPQGLGKLTEAMISGFGSIDTANNKICFTPSTTGTYTFIASVTDSCGLSKRDTIVANVTMLAHPLITCPSGPITKFLCATGQICQALAITPGSATVTTSFGTYSGGNLCFQADTTGTYHIRVIASTSCSSDTCNLTFNVTLNHPPVASAGPDQTVFQCAPAQICWPASCSDVDNNLDSCKLISGSGTYNGSNICFTPAGSGIYTFVIRAVDLCGLSKQDTVKITVTANGTPNIAFGNDTTMFLCAPQQICLNYSVSDPNGIGKLTEAMVSGFGSIDTANNKVCFTPASAGTYDFIVSLTDSCGASDRDTIRAIVTFGDHAQITCINSPINAALCATGQVCQALTVSPAGATVTTSFGTYSGGNLCFQADTSGTYHIRVIAATTCSSDTCNLTFNVTIGTAAQVSCPPLQTKFICQPGSVCIPVGIVAPGGTVTVTPIGTYSAGSICFQADTTGHYVIKIKATTSCGSDSCQLVANVTIDAPPVAVNPTTPKDTFMCASAQICYQFSASDPNGGALTWSKLGGPGAISAGGQWCFTPVTAGAYAITAVVSDSCGKADTTTLTYNVTLNHAPVVHLGNDTTVFICAGGSMCLPYTITDADNNVTLEQLTTGTGTIDTVNNKVCFTPGSPGAYTFVVKGTDACNATSSDTINVTVSVGQAPVVTCPGTQTKFLCAAASICYPVTITGTSPTVTVTPLGTYSAGNVCFNADTTGHYVIKIKAANSCGADSCQLVVNVTINSRPLAVDPPASVDTFLCASGQICRQFGATDPNGGALTWTRLSGAGTVTTGGQWCFTANASGAYSIVAKVSDSCGAADTVSMTYNVTINTAPLLSLGPDTTIFQCIPTQICLGYTLTDPNNNGVNAVLISGNGTLFVGPNSLCFTPTVSGVYSFVVEASDNCNAKARDTINVTVNLNRPPVVNAGSDQTVFQCSQQTICWPTSASDPDGNLSTVQLISGPGTYSSNQICFTPTGSLNYEFVLKATDACGLTAFDTVVIYYTLNSAPVAHAGNDTTVFQCSPTQICMPANCTDLNGNLTSCALISGPGTYDGTNICFTPSVTGTYTFIIEATDACNLKGRDTVVAHVTLNSGPVCHIPNDTTIFQCATSQVCLPVSATDADNNLTSCQILSGPGSLAGGNWCYTPSGTQSVTVQIKCTDACGAQCISQFKVDFIVNQPPQIAFGADTSMFLCASTQVCLPYTAFDPNDPRPRTITLVSGPGSLDLPNSRVCFTPAATGSYTFVVKIQDECGAFAQDTIHVGITLNQPPVASVGPDFSKFVCDSLATICWPASCSDPNNNLASCLFNGPGTYDGSQICFHPAITGAYLFTLKATDSCGVSMTDTVVVNVTINSKPNIAFGNDTTLFLCAPQQICLGYTVTDPNGMARLTESMVSGFGSIDTALNKICFTPSTSGTYDFIVNVTDSCGASDLDTIRAIVTFGEHAHINCLTSPIAASLCATGQVCQALSITPVGATVTTSFGTYSGGNVCFQADSSGTYHIRVIASTACSSDTCNLTFNVTIGQAAQIVCPAPQTRFICQAGSVCIPVTVMGTGATVTVTPIGTYSAGNVCFQADTTGNYVLKVKATTTCGSDSCQITANVTINSRPVAVNPATPKDTFLCASAQICYQFAASDPNGGALVWNKLSGAGSISSTGLWCFTPGANGAYTVIAAVGDSCGASDTTTLTYNVTMNLPPTVTLGPDKVKPICLPGQICVSYTAADPNNNAILEQLISGSGTIDTLANTVCFTASVSGTTTLVVKVTDACGAFAQDTINVTVNLNQPPVINAGANASVFQCTPAQLCYPITASDPNNNLDSVKVISGTGTIVNNAGNRTLCFTPSGSGAYTFILRAVDSCGASAQDTVVYTVTVNAPPVCMVPNDTVIFQCVPTPVSLPLSGTDPNNNFDHCEIVSGPGSIVSGHWNYTPSTDELRKVVVMCVDQCGAICKDSFTIEFKLNAPPVLNSGKDSTYFMCQSGAICWPVTATDEDNNLMSVQLMSGPGTYNPGTHQLCANVTFVEGQTQFLTFVVKATDSCNAVTFDTTNITVKFNHAPVISAPPNFTAYLDQIGQLCFDVDVTDADNNLSSVNVSPVGTYNSSTHQICFTATTTGQQCLIITATDACNRSVVDTVCIEVVIDECIHVQIEKTHNAIQGQFENVNIFLNGSGKQLGGFDLLISYDATALTPMSVAIGQLLVNCGWEYFTYRQGANGNCGSGCPSGLLRIVGIAETNNGAYHPTCYFDNMVGSLATISFLVSNDRTLECQFSPVSFYWIACEDNSFSSLRGDTLWVSRKVLSLELNNIADYNTVLPGYFGTPNQCLINPGPGKIPGQRCVDFINGGVDIVCADSIDARGDINLNSVSYEVADAVMFTNYFVYGISAFGTNPQHVQGSIAATDVNADGLSLTVADLVYLIRVIAGDAVPTPKIVAGHEPKAEISVNNGILEISKTEVPVGALYIVLNGDVHPRLHESASNMEMKYSFDGTNTRVLIFAMNGRAFLDKGPVLYLKDAHGVKSVEAGSYNGEVVATKLHALPTTYELSQNYPNPFNPLTTIEFALPNAGKWNLSIYNILGQEVATFGEESDAGYYKIEWDAGRYASGVYLYRLTAGNYSATRKMVLLK